MGPQHGIVGDNFGTDLPKTDVPEDFLVEEKKLAKYSKTAEFKRFQEYVAFRENEWKLYLPGGVKLRDLTNEERGWRALAADYVIQELRGIEAIYLNADEVVKDAGRQGTS